jgi:hypothetical protein
MSSRRYQSSKPRRLRTPAALTPGTAPTRTLADRAASAGIEHFTATIPPENAPTIALLRGLGVTNFPREDSLLSVRTTSGDWPTTPPQRAGPRRQPGPWYCRIFPRSALYLAHPG